MLLVEVVDFTRQYIQLVAKVLYTAPSHIDPNWILLSLKTLMCHQVGANCTRYVSL